MNTPHKPDLINPPPPPPEGAAEEAEAPAALIAGLRALADRGPAVSAEFDAQVLSAARGHLRAIRFRRQLRWSMSIAAVVVLMAGVSLPFLWTRLNPSPSGGPSGAGGGADILPAFELARQLKAGQHPDARWDANGDGRVDAGDVDALARRAVKVQWDQAAPPIVGVPKFVAVDLFVDPHGKALAAYQATFSARGVRARIVGVGNGEGEAFGEKPPYYDLAAQDGGSDHLTLAMYSTLPAGRLPNGLVRVATLNLMIEGDGPPIFEAVVRTAADATGEKIVADVLVKPEIQK